MRLLLMGPPGAGKGTQGARVAAAYGVPAISTGDIFRANVRDRTELGLRAQTFMDAGEYVADEVTNLMVRDRLREPDAADGFLLDGYPRTLAQVDELDAVLAEQGQRLDAVVVVDVEQDELVRRLLQRAHEGGRTDDTEPVIRRRLQVYAEQTAPLVEHYRGRGLLVEVDGAGDVPEVAERLANALRVGPPVLGTTPTNTP